jgi:hypothetical protein
MSYFGYLSNFADDDLRALQAEYARLRERLAALVGEPFSGMIEVASHMHCAYCGAMHPLYVPRTTQHKSDCPIVLAREALGGE